MFPPIRRGDVFWLAAGGTGPHPHVVVQEDVFNKSRVHTVIVCGLTSNVNTAKEPGNVLLDEGEGHLPKRSVVVATQILSVEKTLLGGKIGTLSGQRVEEILAALRTVQASFFYD